MMQQCKTKNPNLWSRTSLCAQVDNNFKGIGRARITNGSSRNDK